MAAVATAPRTRTRLDDLKLRKLTWQEKVQNVIYSVIGLHLGVIIIYAVYVIFFLGTYQFFGYDFTLKNWWLNLPLALHLPSGLSWASINGWPAGGVGNFIAGNWDLIQHSYFLTIPMGITGFVFIGLIVSKASKKPLGQPGKMDTLMCRAGFPNRHQGQVRGADHEKTSLLQWAFLLPSMLIWSLPGVIGFSLLFYGGGALLHLVFGGVPATEWYAWFGHPSVPHPAFADPYVAGHVWQPIAIGFGGARFFGRKAVAKPAEDMQLFWLEEALFSFQSGLQVIQRVRTDPSGRVISDETAVDGTTKLRNPVPNKLRAPVFRLRYEALEHLVLLGKMTVYPHGQYARWSMRFVMAVGTFLVVYGAYMYVWFPRHGGWLL